VLAALGPVVVVGIILVLYPETAHKELEELNPEDAPPPADLAGIAALEADLERLEDTGTIEPRA